MTLYLAGTAAISFAFGVFVGLMACSIAADLLRGKRGKE